MNVLPTVHCPNCGGELKIIAAILEQPVSEKVLLTWDCRRVHRLGRQPVATRCKRPEAAQPCAFARGRRGAGWLHELHAQRRQLRTLTLDEVFYDYFGDLGVPVYRGAMFGHVARKFTLPLGVPAEMDADAGTLRLLETAVT